MHAFSYNSTIGPIDFINLNDFSALVRREITTSGQVSTVKATPPSSNIALFGDMYQQSMINVSELRSSLESSYQKDTWKLEKHTTVRIDASHLLTIPDFTRNPMAFRTALFQAAQERLLEFVREELTILACKATPMKFVKELTVGEIEQMTYKMLQQGICDPPKGVLIALNPYQKFFILMNAEDFTFFHSELTEEGMIRVANADAMELRFRGVLASLHPERWFMARYDVDKYRI